MDQETVARLRRAALVRKALENAQGVRMHCLVTLDRKRDWPEAVRMADFYYSIASRLSSMAPDRNGSTRTQLPWGHNEAKDTSITLLLCAYNRIRIMPERLAAGPRFCVLNLL